MFVCVFCYRGKVGQCRTWTIWQYRSIWLVYELSSPRVRESANWPTRLILTLTLTWHRSIQTEKLYNEISAVLVGSSNFTNQSFDQVVTASGKMLSVDHRMAK